MAIKKDTRHPCPECVNDGFFQLIGNRRGKCATCNRFAAAVRRETLKRLAIAQKDEYERIKATVEQDLYVSTVLRIEDV